MHRYRIEQNEYGNSVKILSLAIFQMIEIIQTKYTRQLPNAVWVKYTTKTAYNDDKIVVLPPGNRWLYLKSPIYLTTSTCTFSLFIIKDAWRLSDLQLMRYFLNIYILNFWAIKANCDTWNTVYTDKIVSLNITNVYFTQNYTFL